MPEDSLRNRCIYQISVGWYTAFLKNVFKDGDILPYKCWQHSSVYIWLALFFRQHQDTNKYYARRSIKVKEGPNRMNWNGKYVISTMMMVSRFSSKLFHYSAHSTNLAALNSIIRFIEVKSLRLLKHSKWKFIIGTWIYYRNF